MGQLVLNLFFPIDDKTSYEGREAIIRRLISKNLPTELAPTTPITPTIGRRGVIQFILNEIKQYIGQIGS